MKVRRFGGRHTFKKCSTHNFKVWRHTNEMCGTHFANVCCHTIVLCDKCVTDVFRDHGRGLPGSSVADIRLLVIVNDHEYG